MSYLMNKSIYSFNLKDCREFVESYMKIQTTPPPDCLEDPGSYIKNGKVFQYEHSGYDGSVNSLTYELFIIIDILKECDEIVKDIEKYELFVKDSIEHIDNIRERYRWVETYTTLNAHTEGFLFYKLLTIMNTKNIDKMKHCNDIKRSIEKFFECFIDIYNGERELYKKTIDFGDCIEECDDTADLYIDSV